MKLMNKFCWRLLYKILSKTDEKCRKCRKNFIYTLKQYMACTAPAFTKLVKNMDSMGANSLAPLGKL
jgi:hypothetical protein